MSNFIPPKLFAAMANEIRAWREEEIINDLQAATLLARYPLGAERSSAVTLLTTIGAVLIGLGTLLYIGANWQVLSTIWKIMLIVLAVICSHWAGWIFKFEPGLRPKLGTAFLLLGSFFFGSGIWLIAQMYNIDINYPDGLMLWFLGTAASALVTRSAAVGILASLILGTWSMHLNGWTAWLGQSKTVDYPIVTGTLAGLALAYVLRSRAMTWITLLTSTMWIIACSATECAGLAMWGFLLFAVHLWAKRNMQLLEQPFKYIGICSTLTATLILTCSRAIHFGTINYSYYYGLICAALLMLLTVHVSVREYRNIALACLLSIGYFLLFAGSQGEMTRVVAFNFLTVAGIIGLAWAGAKQLHSPGAVNTAIVYAVFYIICRYFDFFFSMMDRSLFFVMGGIVLMTIGALAERGRRQLIGSMAA